jgi:hypothetical protein
VGSYFEGKDSLPQNMPQRVYNMLQASAVLYEQVPECWKLLHPQSLDAQAAAGPSEKVGFEVLKVLFIELMRPFSLDSEASTSAKEEEAESGKIITSLARLGVMRQATRLFDRRDGTWQQAQQEATLQQPAGLQAHAVYCACDRCFYATKSRKQGAQALRTDVSTASHKH